MGIHLESRTKQNGFMYKFIVLACLIIIILSLCQTPCLKCYMECVIISEWCLLLVRPLVLFLNYVLYSLGVVTDFQ